MNDSCWHTSGPVTFSTLLLYLFYIVRGLGLGILCMGTLQGNQLADGVSDEH